MNDPDANGVIDFKKAKSQLAASKKAKAGSSAKDKNVHSKPKNKIFLYIQYLVLLAVVAYMMQLCRA